MGCINADEPARSLRSKYEDGEIILVGGDHHKTGRAKILLSTTKHSRF